MSRTLLGVLPEDVAALGIHEFVKFGDVQHKIVPLTVEELYDYVPQIVDAVAKAQTVGIDLDTAFEAQNIVGTAAFVKEELVGVVAFAASLELDLFLSLSPAKALEVVHKVITVNLRANSELLKNLEALVATMENV